MAADQAYVDADLPRIFGFFGFFWFSRWFWPSLSRPLWFFLVFLVFSMVLTSEALVPALHGILAKALEHALQGKVYMITGNQ